MTAEGVPPRIAFTAFTTCAMPCILPILQAAWISACVPRPWTPPVAAPAAASSSTPVRRVVGGRWLLPILLPMVADRASRVLS